MKPLPAFPDELLDKVLESLSAESLANVMLASRHFCSLGRRPGLWQRFVFSADPSVAGSSSTVPTYAVNLRVNGKDEHCVMQGAELERLTNLRSLRVHVKRDTLPFVSRLTGLTSLSIHTNDKTATVADVLECLRDLRDLVHLDMWCYPYGANDLGNLSVIGTLTRLQSLRLPSTMYEHAHASDSAAAVNNLSRLTELHMGSYFRNAGLQLAALTDLRILQLADPVADATTLPQSLTRLYVRAEDTQTAEVVRRLLPGLRNLRALNVTVSDTDIGVSKLLQLQELRLAYDGSDAMWQMHGASTLRGLTKLECVFSVGEGTVEQLRHFEQLESLTITCGERFSNACLDTISALTRLTSLHMSPTFDRTFKYPLDDISPLQALTDLQVLGLVGSRAKNLAPLAGIRRLRRLSLESVLWPELHLSDLQCLSALAGIEAITVRAWGENQETDEPLSFLPAGVDVAVDYRVYIMYRGESPFQATVLQYHSCSDEGVRVKALRE